MREKIMRRKDKKFEKENWKTVVREVAHQAKKIKAELRVNLSHDKQKKKKSDLQKRPPFMSQKEDKYIEKTSQLHSINRQIRQSKNATKKKKDLFYGSLCLNPICRATRKRYWIKNCEIIDKDNRSALLERHRRNEKVRVKDIKERIMGK